MLHLNQGGSLGLGLYHPSRLAVDEEEVVDPAVAFLQDEFPNDDSQPGADVGLVGVLDDPVGCHELLVDVLSRLGNPLAVTDPRNNTTTYERNELGEPYRTTSPAPYNYPVETYYDANRM